METDGGGGGGVTDRGKLIGSFAVHFHLALHFLRRRSSAARLQRLWVRIPSGAWMFVVSVVCCQVEVSAMD
jgi:hypothetical protein